MGVFSEIDKRLKKHSYVIATTAVIGLLIAAYLIFLLPRNERIEDLKNISVFKNIERQLKDHINDRLKGMDKVTWKLRVQADPANPQVKTSKLSLGNEAEGYFVVDNADYTIALIKIVSAKADPKERIIKLYRDIYIKANDDLKDRTIPFQKLHDSVDVDLSEFLKKIPAISNFNAFYACTVAVDSKQVCSVDTPIVIEQVSLKDQQQLVKDCQNEGPFAIPNSSKRYYADQINIAGTKFSFYFAAGVDAYSFNARAREIDSQTLIGCLVLTVLLLLSISFIKPIISDHREGVQQKDLVSVVFSIGIMTSVLVVFGLVSYWDKNIERRTDKDLKPLVEYIDDTFSKQVAMYRNWQNEDSLFGKKLADKDKQFAKIYLKLREKDTLSGKPFITTADGFPIDKDFEPISKSIEFENLDEKSLEAIHFLDSYFRLDNAGFLMTYISKDQPGFRRFYNDRSYFKMIKDTKLQKVLTGVYSRENNEYQWIYARRDNIKKQINKPETDGVFGIAFRDKFSKSIKLPPETDYMLVDRTGEVLMQHNANKNLYQNLLLGLGGENKKLLGLLSGVDKPAEMDIKYQGIPYRIHAKKMNTPTDSPVYIIGIRELLFKDRLSLFTFSNVFLISVLYGMFMLLMTLFYSSVLFSGHLKMFSRQHFYYLFPDKNRGTEYRLLVKANCAVMILALVICSCLSSATGLFCSFVFGINAAFLNLILLNFRLPKDQIKYAFYKLAAICFALGIAMPILLMAGGFFFAALFVLFAFHIGFIVICKEFYTDLFTFKKDTQTKESVADESDANAPSAKQFNRLNRKAYSGFMTTVLLNHFAIFPFILSSAFYFSELGDFSDYYCSEYKSGKKYEQAVKSYGCDCDSILAPDRLYKSFDKAMQKINLGFLDRPVDGEIQKFTFDKYLDWDFSMENVSMRDEASMIALLFAGFLALVCLIYKLINYYSNRFFFYDLIEAAQEGYYPRYVNPYHNDLPFVPMITDGQTKEIIENQEPVKVEKPENETDPIYANWTASSRIPIDQVFDTDKQIPPMLRMEFYLNSNYKEYHLNYSALWESLDEDCKYVLFDFVSDNFTNYKNKVTIMRLMEIGIIVTDTQSGRLKLMNENFRNYVLTLGEREPDKITKLLGEDQNKTFGKLKVPIMILSVSLLLLLFYLNRESYDRIALVGGSLTTIVTFINGMLTIGKGS